MVFKQKKNRSKIIPIIILIFLISPAIGFTTFAAESPQQQWIKIYSNGHNDKAYAVITDSNNNVIVTGLSKINAKDTAYTIIYNTEGIKILEIISNTPYGCKGYDVAVDSHDNIIIAGACMNSTGDYDYYIAKYNPYGVELWSKTYDSGNKDIAYGIAVDSNDNIVVTGKFSDNYYTIKLDEYGTKLWEKTYDNSYEDCAKAVTIDSYDNIIVTGYIYTSNGINWHTIKYNSNGIEQWNKSHSSGHFNYAKGVATDSNNNIIVVGTVYNQANANIHTIKYNKDGGEIWSRTYDQSTSESAADVATNAINEIIIIGSASKIHEKRNYALLKYDSNGNLIWTKNYDRYNADDYGSGVAVDTLNNILITGFSKNLQNFYDYVTIKYGDIIIQDTEKPEISNVQDQPDPQVPDGHVNITCDVTDNIGVDTVKVNITHPDNSTVNETMIKGSYYYNNTYAQLGIYYYFIWAQDTSGNENTSDTYSFTITAEPNNPPYEPSNPVPTDGALEIDTNVDLSWIGGDPDLGDTVTYDVYFGTTNPPPKVITNQSETAYDPGVMDLSTTYYWQIIAWDNQNALTEGKIWSFTTVSVPNNPPQTPAIPSGTTPGYICVSYDFNTSTTDPDGDNVTYGWDWDGDRVVDEWSNEYLSGETCTMSHSWDEPRTYSVSVKAKDTHIAESAWSNPFNVTIENHPPNVPNNPIPLNNSTGIDINTDLSWDGGDSDSCDIVTYDVYFGVASPPSKIEGNQSDTTYDDPGTLDYDTTYYWMIVSWDNYSANSEGPIWQFTTGEEPNNPPYVPSDPIPADGVTGVDINADLSWTGGDPDPGDTVTYDVYFGNVSLPPKIESNQTDTTYDPGTLDYKTIYYWLIVAWDNQNASAKGPIWSFTTRVNDPPFEPSNPKPENGLTDVDVDADLSWTGGDPNSDPVLYDVYFGNISPPPKNVSNQSDSNYDPGTMILNMTYYWQIVSWDSYGAFTVGSIWNFTTGLNIKPVKPNQPDGPISGYICESYDYNTSATDPDGDNVTYGWDWDGDRVVDEWSNEYLSGETCTMSHSWDEPGPYSVKVKAKDIHLGTSVWSSPLNVTIENHPPNVPINPIPLNNSTGVDINADLSWTGGDNDSCDTVLYDVYFGITNPPKVEGNQSDTTYDPGELNYNTTYYWQIIAWDNQNASAKGSIWSFTTLPEDIEPPLKVTGLSVTDAKDGKLDLVWDAASDNVAIAYYRVYRDDLFLKNTSDASTTYQDKGLNNGQTYTYQVSAVDTSENEGEKSDPESGTPTASDTGNGGNGGNGGGGQPPIGNQPPIANASAGEPYQGVTNSEIMFNGSLSYDPDNSGYITSWYWDFGDGTNGTGETTTHIYSNPETYIVNLTVTDNEGATDTYSTIATISQPNRPPSNPEINGPAEGEKNIQYTFTAVSTDLDNDTIKYTFDWDDGSTDESEFLPSGTTFSINHTWTAAGKHIITAKAFDNQTESATIQHLLLIDSIYVDNIGYLIDTDGDGTYDLFHNDETGQETEVNQDEDGNYLIDIDGDDDFDYIYAPENNELTDYEESSAKKQEENATTFFLLALIVLIFFIFYILYKRNRDKKKAKLAKLAEKKQKKKPPKKPVKKGKQSTKKTGRSKK